MNHIIEEKIGTKSVFIIKEIIAEEVINQYTVSCHTVVVPYNNKNYPIIYDSKREVITDVYRFLNHSKKQLSKNTVTKSLYALNYLYTFAEIIKKDVKTFDHNDFVKLNYFLKGVSAQGIDMEFDLLTKRSNTSILGFFSIYRDYFRYLGLLQSALFVEDSYSKYIPATQTSAIKSITSTYSSIRVKEVPKYISIEEFKKIVKYIRENIEDKEIRLRDECLVRVMFEGGLRLGEALGSTLEDYVVNEVGEGDDAKEICYVYIRNRFTDKKFQKAKTCMNITTRRNYSNYEYAVKNVGYQLSFLSVDTYDLIDEYIDLAHEKYIKNSKEHYDTAKADAVGEYKTNRQDNYYLFLNLRGTPLSDVSWNKKLRKIFKAVGIEVNYGVKKDNLSHRFRHGFVMNLIHNLKMPKEQVKVRSRHRSDASLDVYYNPTTEQIVTMKTEIEDEILNLDDI